MLTAIRTTLTGAGIGEPLQRLATDSGYWSIANVSTIPDAPELLIPPARHGRHGKPRKDGKPSESKSDGVRAAMRAKLIAGPSRAYYAQRSRTIEPVFGQVKTVQGGGRFMRPGLRACAAEWQLPCGTHNLLKLWRTTMPPDYRPAPARPACPLPKHQRVTRATHPHATVGGPSPRARRRRLCATGSSLS
jgi:hypothetical protein